MTEWTEVIEEVDDYRVRLELDDSGEKPEDDCACAVLQVGTTYRDATIAAFNEQAEGFQAAYHHFVHHAEADALTVFERYLRIFHGTMSFVVKDSENYRYIGFDTPAWREKVGLTPSYVIGQGMDPKTLADGTVEEVVAWANGEVYGYIVEKKVHWAKTYDEDADMDDEDGYDWVEVEDGACWGHYGRDWAEQAAREALDEARADYHNMTWYVDGVTATARVDWRKMEEWAVDTRNCADRNDMSNEDFKDYMSEFKLPYTLDGKYTVKVESGSEWTDVEEAR